METTWSKTELQVYLLVFCANADFVEAEEEIELIQSKIDPKIYAKIHDEFKADNDHQSIQKILFTLEKYNYSKKEIEDLIAEMKSLFLSDGKFVALERNLFMGLKRLFQLD